MVTIAVNAVNKFKAFLVVFTGRQLSGFHASCKTQVIRTEFVNSDWLGYHSFLEMVLWELNLSHL